MTDNPILLVQVKGNRYESMDEVVTLNPEWSREDILGFMLMTSPSDYFN